MRKLVGSLLFIVAAAIFILAAVYYLDRNRGVTSNAITSVIQFAGSFLIVALIAAMGIIFCFFVFKKERQWLGSAFVVLLAVLWVHLFGESLTHRQPVSPAIAMAAPSCRGTELPHTLGSTPVGTPTGCFMYFDILDGTAAFQDSSGHIKYRSKGSKESLGDTFDHRLVWGSPSATVVFYFCPIAKRFWKHGHCATENE